MRRAAALFAVFVLAASACAAQTVVIDRDDFPPPKGDSACYDNAGRAKPGTHCICRDQAYECGPHLTCRIPVCRSGTCWFDFECHKFGAAYECHHGLCIRKEKDHE